MAGASARDEFDVVFREMYLPAFRVALRVLNNVTDAEDAAAEGLSRALRAWSRIGGLPYRNAWIMRVTLNVAIDQARRRRPSSVLAEQSVHDRTDEVVESLGLAAALADLPTRQREVVSLRYLADLSEVEVAASLGISVSSVKTHASRGLAALRGRLGPAWGPNLALE